jgi:hypothetical protein
LPLSRQLDGKKLAASDRTNSSREQFPAGVDEHLRACDDIGIGRVFLPVMADAVDRGHEHHAGRHDVGEHLGIMAGGAWHAQ